jgi:hypothetical protein
MPKLCAFQEDAGGIDSEPAAVVYVNPARVRTVRPNGDRSVIAFDDIHSVGVRLPAQNVVEQLNEKMIE